LRRDCPPRLYKYFAADRWRFFSDLRVRYSQLGVFNDPFEGRPEITSLSSKEDTLATLGRVLPEEIERAYAQLPKHVQAAISYKQVFLLAEQLAQIKQPEMLGALELITPHAASFITGKIDQALGVLCLSEVPDSLLMWAHYASSHTGFVVEFDAWHPSFHEQKSDEDDLRHLRRVYYRESRPSAPLSSMSAIELFLVKSGHWGYEREWRIVRPLVDAVATVPAHPYPIRLFEIPAAAITEVILGARMSDAMAADMRNAIRANTTLASLRIRRAIADSSHFLVRFEDDT
jgi:hypothetical protein